MNFVQAKNKKYLKHLFYNSGQVDNCIGKTANPILQLKLASSNIQVNLSSLPKSRILNCKESLNVLPSQFTHFLTLFGVSYLIRIIVSK